MSEVNVKVGLTSASFKSGLASLKSDLSRWKEEQVSAFKGLGAQLTGVLTVGAAIEFTKSLVAMGREIRETASEVGLSSESFQQWKKVLGKFGADEETVVEGLKKLSEHIQEARDGSESMIASFARAGVTWGDLHRLSPEQILLKISDALHRIRDPATSVAMAVELLGKGGAKMAVGLKQGSEELNSLKESAKTLSDEQLEVLEKASRSYDAIIAKIKFIAAHGFLGLVNPAGNVTDQKGASAGQLQSGTGSAYFGQGVVPHDAPKELRDVAVPDLQKNPVLSAEERRKIEAEASEKKSRAQFDAIVNAPSDFVPSDPATAKQATEQAKQAVEMRLQELKTAESLSDIDAEDAEKKRAMAVEIAEIQRQAGYAQAASEAKIAGITSKHLELTKEEALVHQQIADNKDLIADSTTEPREKAALAAENQANEAKLIDIAERRKQLDREIAKEEREAGYEREQAAVALLALTDSESGKRAQIALLEQQIAGNVIEAKNADELRTAEIGKQNVALQNQIEALKNVNAIQHAKEQNDPELKRKRQQEEGFNSRAIRAAGARERDHADTERRNDDFLNPDKKFNDFFHPPKPVTRGSRGGPRPPLGPPKPEGASQLQSIDSHLEKIQGAIETLAKNSTLA